MFDDMEAKWRAKIATAVAAEREACARWHDEQAEFGRQLKQADVGEVPPEVFQIGWHVKAAAALRSRPDSAPDMVLVPREPTEAMICAGNQAIGPYVYGDGEHGIEADAAYQCYRAMIAAAVPGDGPDSVPDGVCCFCSKTITPTQAYDTLPGGRRCHMACWPRPAAVAEEGKS